ncbi:Inorganic pyrophosphatase [Tulasnella sp. JGI-2019a]|nr:Inorganic pyrophosphatase [Tulasnella sp. JGI-2019a]
MDIGHLNFKPKRRRLNNCYANSVTIAGIMSTDLESARDQVMEEYGKTRPPQAESWHMWTTNKKALAVSSAWDRKRLDTSKLSNNDWIAFRRIGSSSLVHYTKPAEFAGSNSGWTLIRDALSQIFGCSHCACNRMRFPALTRPWPAALNGAARSTITPSHYCHLRKLQMSQKIPASPNANEPSTSSVRRLAHQVRLLSTAPSSSSSTSSDQEMAQYQPRLIGAANTLDHRVFLENANQVVSSWHDIPLFADQNAGILNMVVEVPRWTNAKMEICKEEAFNPIKQDIKKGKLRFVRNCFPHHGYIWNYGAFPQTWEDPQVMHAETKAKGDNDPLDVCEIGEQVGYVGQVKQVKVLGIMALLDEGETDWKVLVVDIRDPLASKLNDIEDVERHLPGLIRATNEWFRIYKIPDGKPENVFAFSGEAKNKKYATEIIHECHEAWRRLMSNEALAKTPSYSLSTVNCTVQSSTQHVQPNNPIYQSVPPDSRQPPAPIDPSISKWFYISSATV